MTKIGTTFLTIAGDVLAPALAIAEYPNGDIFAIVQTETATVRMRLAAAPSSERSALRPGQYLHPAQMIDNTAAPLAAAAAAIAAASKDLEGLPND